MISRALQILVGCCLLPSLCLSLANGSRGGTHCIHGTCGAFVTPFSWGARRTTTTTLDKKLESSQSHTATCMYQSSSSNNNNKDKDKEDDASVSQKKSPGAPFFFARKTFPIDVFPPVGDDEEEEENNNNNVKSKPLSVQQESKTVSNQKENPLPVPSPPMQVTSAKDNSSQPPEDITTESSLMDPISKRNKKSKRRNKASSKIVADYQATIQQTTAKTPVSSSSKSFLETVSASPMNATYQIMYEEQAPTRTKTTEPASTTSPPPQQQQQEQPSPTTKPLESDSVVMSTMDAPTTTNTQQPSNNNPAMDQVLSILKESLEGDKTSDEVMALLDLLLKEAEEDMTSSSTTATATTTTITPDTTEPSFNVDVTSSQQQPVESDTVVMSTATDTSTTTSTTATNTQPNNPAMDQVLTMLKESLEGDKTADDVLALLDLLLKEADEDMSSTSSTTATDTITIIPPDTTEPILTSVAENVTGPEPELGDIVLSELQDAKVMEVVEVEPLQEEEDANLEQNSNVELISGNVVEEATAPVAETQELVEQPLSSVPDQDDDDDKTATKLLPTALDDDAREEVSSSLPMDVSPSIEAAAAQEPMTINRLSNDVESPEESNSRKKMKGQSLSQYTEYMSTPSEAINTPPETITDRSSVDAIDESSVVVPSSTSENSPRGVPSGSMLEGSSVEESQEKDREVTEALAEVMTNPDILEVKDDADGSTSDTSDATPTGFDASLELSSIDLKQDAFSPSNEPISTLEPLVETSSPLFSEESNSADVSENLDQVMGQAMAPDAAFEATVDPDLLGATDIIPENAETPTAEDLKVAADRDEEVKGGYQGIPDVGQETSSIDYGLAEESGRFKQGETSDQGQSTEMAAEPSTQSNQGPESPIYGEPTPQETTAARETATASEPTDFLPQQTGYTVWGQSPDPESPNTSNLSFIQPLQQLSRPTGTTRRIAFMNDPLGAVSNTVSGAGGVNQNGMGNPSQLDDDLRAGVSPYEATLRKAEALARESVIQGQDRQAALESVQGAGQEPGGMESELQESTFVSGSSDVNEDLSTSESEEAIGRVAQEEPMLGDQGYGSIPPVFGVLPDQPFGNSRPWGNSW